MQRDVGVKVDCVTINCVHMGVHHIYHHCIDKSVHLKDIIIPMKRKIVPRTGVISGPPRHSHIQYQDMQRDFGVNMDCETINCVHMGVHYICNHFIDTSVHLNDIAIPIKGIIIPRADIMNGH